MAEEYVPNSMDTEFAEFWARVNCFAVVGFPYDQRCEFVEKANNCLYGTNVVPYMHLMSCTFKCRNKFEELIFVTLFLVLCCELVFCLGYVANKFYSPALKVVARMMHMNEHLAGVTIMTFGNALPDMCANISSASTDLPILSNSMSTAVVTTMFVGGLVCYIRPFKMSAYTTMRDLLFFIFGIVLLDYFNHTDDRIKLYECISLIVLYGAYMTVTLLDVYLKSITIIALKRDITTLENMPQSEENDIKLENLQRKYEGLHDDNRVAILQRRSMYNRESYLTYKTPQQNTHSVINLQNIREPTPPTKNHHLFRQFFHSIRPVSSEDWANATLLVRAFYVIRAPVAVFAAIYIPLLDYELENNGWSKLLNCIQIFVNPAITIILVKSLILADKSRLWYYNIPYDVKYSLYSLIVTVPLAIFVFFNSNTSQPPPYHWLFTIGNLSGSIFINFQCSTEISLIVDVIGTILDVPTDFMGFTVLAVATSLGDLVNNVSMAIQGYEKMAYAATIGGPFFTLFLSNGTILICKIIADQSTELSILNGVYGQNAYVMLIIGLMSTLLWTSVLNFNSRRSVGIFSISVCFLHFLFAVLIKNGIIHQFDVDPSYSDTYVPMKNGD